MKLTEHFTLEELTHSDTAIRLCIDQTPPPVVLNNLLSTASQMEVVRALLGKPIRVSSGYRSPALNKIISPAVTKSAHIDGRAVDFTCPEFGTPQRIAKFLSECPTIQFDQLIYEGTWVHIGFAPVPRREVLTAHFNDGHTTYTKGIT